MTFSTTYQTSEPANPPPPVHSRIKVMNAYFLQIPIYKNVKAWNNGLLKTL